MAPLSNHGQIAANRFGLGVRLDEVSTINSSPKKWLLRQIDNHYPLPNSFAKLPSSKQIIQKSINVRATKDKEKIKAHKKTAKQLFNEEMNARIQEDVITDRPFLERLVHFWSNHFTVSTKRKEVVGLVGSFEREVIRKHVMGNFSNMLMASCKHPCMLTYLDNIKSIGPKSKTGKKQGKGLNENLAREILELHTLGVNGGYSQTDVQALANIITGWTVNNKQGKGAGEFEFKQSWHEPGTHKLLGKDYKNVGLSQGEEAIRMLAHHTSTAYFVARKLATHFISDNPSKKSVDKLARTFLQTGGNLPKLYKTLVELPESWQEQSGKMRSNHDLILAVARLAIFQPDERHIKYIKKSMEHLGNAPFTAPGPDGFSDKEEDIIGPNIMLRRIEWAEEATQRFFKGLKNYMAADVAQAILGKNLKQQTLEAILAAENKRERFAILFASPEFQRR